jgi:GxxExxY protein
MDAPRSHGDTGDHEMDAPRNHGDAEFADVNRLTARIIGCAIDVHKALGPGLLESLYESAMCIEFDDVKIEYSRQTSIPAYYKGHLLGQYRVDLVVEDLVLVEIKSVERPVPVFEAQLQTYMRLMEKRVGLLINFNSRLLKDGIKRIVV